MRFNEYARASPCKIGHSFREGDSLKADIWSFTIPIRQQTCLGPLGTAMRCYVGSSNVPVEKKVNGQPKAHETRLMLCDDKLAPSLTLNASTASRVHGSPKTRDQPSHSCHSPAEFACYTGIG